jgi:hypothetical protein
MKRIGGMNSVVMCLLSKHIQTPILPERETEREREREREIVTEERMKED